jgi:hypothetical protein
VVVGEHGETICEAVQGGALPIACWPVPICRCCSCGVRSVPRFPFILWRTRFPTDANARGAKVRSTDPRCPQILLHASTVASRRMRLAGVRFIISKPIAVMSWHAPSSVQAHMGSSASRPVGKRNEQG